MFLSDYDYELPPELIAQEPLPCRSDARLMVVDRKTQTFQHRHVGDLPDFLNQNDILVSNNTKVIPARLIGKRIKTGGHWEGLFLQTIPPDDWQIICKTRGKIESGESVQLLSPDNKSILLLKFVTKKEDHTWLVKPVSEQTDSLKILEQIGWTPIPPYIRHGKLQPFDRDRYQTVYAAHSGSIAAPTAGLHFTPELIDTLKFRGTNIASVTLHVGIGTFKPITAENIEEHQIHSEWCSLPEETVSVIRQCKKNSGKTVAVGTTSVRVLESAPDPIQSFNGTTSLFIRPPYQFRNVDMLLTNFHFPKSTLLILVRTFGGDELIRNAYQEAIQKKYRFFSYGDAMLIL